MVDHQEEDNGALRSWLRNALFVGAPVLAAAIALFTDLDPDKPAVTYTLAVAVWMALWWISEVAPLAITSLLPLVVPRPPTYR